MTDKRLLNKNWRIHNLYKIKDKHQKLIKFKRNKAQEHFNEHRHTRNIILKSRQLGFTTDETIDTMDDMLFTRNFNGIFIAQDLETAKDIFDNKIKLAWDNFKLQSLYESDLDSARKIKIGFGDKTFSSIVVDSSGRSGTFNRLHATEFAKMCKDFPDKAKEVLEGTIPAIPTDGRVDIESTAQESEGLFYDIFWQAWDRGEPQHKTQFKAHFYNWQWDEEIESIEPIKDLPIEFRLYQEKYKLTDKEISWYYLKFVALGEHERNWGAMKREYPTTPEEAFEGSGTKHFDLEKLGLQKAKLPIKEYNGFRIFKEYKLGHKYAMGVDTAEGIGKDSNTIVLWDFTPAKPEIVAEYDNNNIAPDLFAFEIKSLAEKYEYPLVAVERNNTGHTTISKLREIYPDRHIYKDDKEKYGWQTNLVNKPKMLFDMSTAINEELVDINSGKLLSEMRRYDKEELRIIRITEDQTKHWDLLMAAVIGFQMRSESIRRNPVRSSTGSRVVRGTGIHGT